MLRNVRAEGPNALVALMLKADAIRPVTMIGCSEYSRNTPSVKIASCWRSWVTNSASSSTKSTSAVDCVAGTVEEQKLLSWLKIMAGVLLEVLTQRFLALRDSRD